MFIYQRRVADRDDRWAVMYDHAKPGQMLDLILNLTQHGYDVMVTNEPLYDWQRVPADRGAGGEGDGDG